MKKISVIDLFAGPGGLAEGFSSVQKQGKRRFDVRLSIEKDEHAHKTLELRSFYRQFDPGAAPDNYYDVLRATDLKERAQLRRMLFDEFGEFGERAKTEAWNATLGSPEFPPDLVDSRISEALGGVRDWVLIGGPPCQAYSLVGRSRVGGIDPEDHRVYLYKEYLRIIARHHPAVFVMENVKGLLSAKVDGASVFEMMLRDLSEPGRVFSGLKSPGYRIYSLVKQGTLKPADYLIKSELYGVPQKRHRVILLGIREDIGVEPGILAPHNEKVSFESIVEKLPPLRSGLNREISGTIKRDDKIRRLYTNLKDSDEEWERRMNDFRREILDFDGLKSESLPVVYRAPTDSLGSEFVYCEETLDPNHSLYDWYFDTRLGGVPNHQSRSHLVSDLKRYMFSSVYAKSELGFPRMKDYASHDASLVPDHKNALSGIFTDRFRVQLPGVPATTVTSHISKVGHYFIHYDTSQCRSLTVREAARVQTFPDNYLFCGSRTQQFHQVGNAVPPYLAMQIGKIVESILS